MSLYKIIIWSTLVLISNSLLKAQVMNGRFGIFGGMSFTSFHRSTEVLVNPFYEKPLLGYEAGLHIPLVSTRVFESKLYLSYFQFGAKEKFSKGEEIYETEIKFNSLKASLLPVVIKFGGPKFKCSIGAGGYVSQSFSYTFKSIPGLVTNLHDELFGNLLYGYQGQLGIHLNRWIIALNGFNGFNPISEGPSGNNAIRNRGITTTLTLMFGKLKDHSVE